MSLRPNTYVPALDGLRGIAAVSVIFNHLALTFAALAGTDLRPLSPWSVLDHWGHNAVILFFVLSGFVLQRTYDTGRSHSYPRYLIKRSFRLLPTFIVVLLAVVLAILIVQPSGQRAETAVLNNPLMLDTSPIVILRHLFFVGIDARDVHLDPPMWSLVYEWRFSLVFPIMATICAPRPVAFLFLAFVGYFAALWICSALGLGWPYIMAGSGRGSVAITLQYLAFFGFGMGLSSWSLKAGDLSIRKPTELAILLGSIVIFSLVRNQLVVALAGFATIAAILYGSASRPALERPLSRWLGAVSYPLYLAHLPVLYFAMYLLKPQIGVLPAVAVGVGLAFIVAEVLHRLVENPANRLGRKLAMTPVGIIKPSVAKSAP